MTTDRSRCANYFVRSLEKLTWRPGCFHHATTRLRLGKGDGKSPRQDGYAAISRAYRLPNSVFDADLTDVARKYSRGPGQDRRIA